MQALTLLGLTGASGVLGMRPQGPPRWHPSAWVMAALGRPAQCLAVEVDDPARLAALALLRRGGCTELLLANLGGEPVEVALEGAPAGTTLQTIDAQTGDAGWTVQPWDAGACSLRLGAYALARLA